MHKFIDGNQGYDLNNSTFTVGSGGSLLNYAEDDNGEGWADWDENLCGAGCGGTVTGTIVPDTTSNSSTGALGLDPTRALGVFNAEATQGSTNQVMSYCIAISVDQATNCGTKGRVVCLDTSKSNGSLSIGQE